MRIPKLKKGDLISIYWVDVFEDGNGDPREATLSVRGPTTAYFWGNKNAYGLRNAVFSYSWEPEHLQQQGFLILPWKLITKVSKIKTKK